MQNSTRKTELVDSVAKPEAPQLRLYAWMSKLTWLNYRLKIIGLGFVGTHLPLLTLIAFLDAGEGVNHFHRYRALGIGLSITLFGSIFSLFLIRRLLQPVVLTAEALRNYREKRQLPALPVHYKDEAGVLMCDTVQTLTELDEAIDRLSHYDRMTGLRNHESLIEALGHLVAQRRPIAVCVLRLINHNQIATSLGQAAAGAVLRELASRLQSASKSMLLAGHLEGSTLAFVLPCPQVLRELDTTTDQLMTKLEKPFSFGGLSISPDLQIAAALYPADALDPESLLANAVAALALSSTGPGPRLNYSRESTRAAAREAFFIEQDLRQALANNELELFYQPVIDTFLGRAVGAEALIRWHHPERGLLEPSSFLAVAESSGLIFQIDDWVFSSACQQINRWASVGLPTVRIAVNLSAREFSDPALIDRLTAKLLYSKVPRHSLEIELTETAMIDREPSRQLFARLKALGLSIAIDDFGTGYSSMSYLKDLPFDRLKIDREFVRDVHLSANNQAICRSLIALSRGLGIDLLAEGVEKLEEINLLRKMGCHLFQGFYFGRALPAADFAETFLVGRIESKVSAEG